MNKEFIPYKEALALKELGFDEPCLRSYSKIDCKLNEADNGLYLKAPLYPQAFRWFRDEHKCYYYIEPIWRNSKIRYEWCVDDAPNAEKFWKEEQICITYEEAELECLKKLIEIVKQKI